MDECLFFSIAVDTALFRNQHMISCIGRFSFDNRALEIPIFISFVLFLRGKKWLASFLKSSRKEKRDLTSSFPLQRTARRIWLERSTGWQHIWKGSLNKTVEKTAFPFQPYIPFGVLHTALTSSQEPFWPWSRWMSFWLSLIGFQIGDVKWPTRVFWRWSTRMTNCESFHSHRRLDGYTWDVVSAILSQSEQVEDFVCGDAEFVSFWNGLRRELKSMVGLSNKIFRSRTRPSKQRLIS